MNSGLQKTASEINSRIPYDAVCKGITPTRYLSILLCDLVIPYMMEDKRTRTFKGFLKITKLVNGKYVLRALDPDPVHGRYPDYIKELGYRMLDAYLWERENYMPLLLSTNSNAVGRSVSKGSYHPERRDYDAMVAPSTKQEREYVALKYDQLLTERQEAWVFRHIVGTELPKDIWSWEWEMSSYRGKNPDWSRIPNFYKQELEHARPLAYMCKVRKRDFYSTRRIMGGFASNNPVGPQLHLSAFCYHFVKGLIDYAQCGMWLKRYNKLYVTQDTQASYCKARRAIILEQR